MSEGRGGRTIAPGGGGTGPGVRGGASGGGGGWGPGQFTRIEKIHRDYRGENLPAVLMHAGQLFPFGAGQICCRVTPGGKVAFGRGNIPHPGGMGPRVLKASLKSPIGRPTGPRDRPAGQLGTRYFEGAVFYEQGSGGTGLGDGRIVKATNGGSCLRRDGPG